jgi:inner membrane protein
MDSITQIALGAAIGEATLGHKVGRRALIWGGLAGLLPDLDVLIPLGDAVSNFTYHRSASHSILVLTLLTPLLVALITKLHPQTARFRFKWHLLIFLAFITHILLDSLTVYGTQIFWPLTTPPVMWSTIFIIDPAYTLPLLIGVLSALIFFRKTSTGHILNTVGLTLSSFYLIWTIGVKIHVEDVSRHSLASQNIKYENLLTVPAPFNTMLWRVLVMDDSGYYEGFYSIFDKAGTIRFNHVLDQKHLLADVSEHWPVKRLQWFTQGFYSVQRLADDIVISDLRMGLEPVYFFQFKVAEIENEIIKPVQNSPVEVVVNLDQLGWVWNRIWTDSAATGYTHR